MEILPAGSTSPAKPDLAVQIQVFRDDEPVVTDPLHRISTDGATDLARIFAAELNLAGLAPGKYVLQLTVIDRSPKRQPHNVSDSRLTERGFSLSLYPACPKTIRG